MNFDDIENSEVMSQFSLSKDDFDGNIMTGGSGSNNMYEDDLLNSMALVQKVRSWKKPLGKPKRPLSAYNIFFQLERDRIVNGECDRLFTSADVAKVRIVPTELMPKRRDRKTHGKVAFADLARLIGTKWKSLESNNRIIFEERAKIEKTRYKQEVQQWLEITKELRNNMIEETRQQQQQSTTTTVTKADGKMTTSPSLRKVVNKGTTTAYPTTSGLKDLLCHTSGGNNHNTDSDWILDDECPSMNNNINYCTVSPQQLHQDYLDHNNNNVYDEDHDHNGHGSSELYASYLQRKYLHSLINAAAADEQVLYHDESEEDVLDDLDYMNAMNNNSNDYPPVNMSTDPLLPLLSSYLHGQMYGGYNQAVLNGYSSTSQAHATAIQTFRLAERSLGRRVSLNSSTSTESSEGSYNRNNHNKQQNQSSRNEQYPSTIIQTARHRMSAPSMHQHSHSSSSNNNLRQQQLSYGRRSSSGGSMDNKSQQRYIPRIVSAPTISYDEKCQQYKRFMFQQDHHQQQRKNATVFLAAQQAARLHNNGFNNNNNQQQDHIHENELIHGHDDDDEEVVGGGVQQVYSNHSSSFDFIH